MSLSFSLYLFIYLNITINYVVFCLSEQELLLDHTPLPAERAQVLNFYNAFWFFLCLNRSISIIKRLSRIKYDLIRPAWHDISIAVDLCLFILHMGEILPMTHGYKMPKTLFDRVFSTLFKLLLMRLSQLRWKRRWTGPHFLMGAREEHANGALNAKVIEKTICAC